MRLRGRACVVMAVLALAGCRAEADVSAPKTIRLFRLGGNQALSDALAREYAARLPGVEVQRIEAAVTSTEALDAMQANTADIGLVSADAGYLASIGRFPGREAVRRIRGIALLHFTSLHLLVPARSTISHLRELRGRRVRLGPADDVVPIADTSLVADLTLRAFGVDPKEVQGELSGIGDSVEQVADGRFDAMFVNASYPFSLLQPAFERGARLVPITGPALDDLIDRYPFIRAVTIPAGTYPGQSAAVSTIGVNVVLVCGAELDERLVYDLTRTFFEALPQLTAAQSSLRLMDPEQAPATPIPLHEGAARYYRESELFR